MRFHVINDELSFDEQLNRLEERAAKLQKEYEETKDPSILEELEYIQDDINDIVDSKIFYDIVASSRGRKIVKAHNTICKLTASLFNKRKK